MAAREDFKAAVEQLVAVSRIWVGTSTVLDGSAGVAESLSLSQGQFSAVDRAIGFFTEYSKLQQLVTTFLHEGATATDGIALALFESAQLYQGTDGENAHDFKKMTK
jgi:hypothetical protein